ncbi:MAG: hypothetical protein ACE5JX_03835 [Acidobacteriota bacterium]
MPPTAVGRSPFGNFPTEPSSYSLTSLWAPTQGRGRFDFRQRDLARVLNKSRRSIGTYLRELRDKQVCRIWLSPNQHSAGILEITDPYWPYQRVDNGDSLQPTRNAETLYVEAIEQMLLAQSCVRCHYSGF